MRPSILALLALTTSCARTPSASAPAHSGEGANAWGYMGPGAPSQWGSLSPEFAKCSTGMFQSPIDLRPIAKADVDALAVSYQPDALRIVNNGHTIQVSHRAESALRVGDHSFRLLQYHLHSPSEHTESGQAHALELHLVHQDEQGNYAVVAVFIEEGSGTHEPALWRHLPELPDGVVHVHQGEEVDPSHFLPASLTHYQYHGSLTTPPCTETVTWNVIVEPITMPPERIAKFRELYGANARPVQPRPTWCLAPHVIGELEAAN